MAEFKRLNVRVRPEMHEWLSTMAEARGLSINAMVIFALETYMQQQQMLPMVPQLLEELSKKKDASEG